MTRGGIEDVRVVVQDEGFWSALHPNVTYVKDSVVGIDVKERKVERKSGPAVGYDALCICTGACPKRLCAADSDLVISLRDTDSVKALSSKLENCESVLIVGNGGIALDLVYVLCSLLDDCCSVPPCQSIDRPSCMQSINSWPRCNLGGAT